MHIPAPPWSTAASSAAFEARLAAVILVSFGAGAVVAALLARRWHRGLQRRIARESAHREQLQAELENVSRLLASSRDKS